MYCCIVSLKQPPRVIRECYQMLGEDSHGKAEDMFNMMDKWVWKNDCLTFLCTLFSFQGWGRDDHRARVHPRLSRRCRALSPSFYSNLVNDLLSKAAWKFRKRRQLRKKTLLWHHFCIHFRNRTVISLTTMPLLNYLTIDQFQENWEALKSCQRHNRPIVQ